MNFAVPKPASFVPSWKPLTLLLIAANFAILSFCMAATTNPSKVDTDGDHYWDGPDKLIDMDGVFVWRIGENKNANGKYEPEGQDGKLGTDDDEFDPNNPTSHPTNFNPLESYDAVADRHDADGDGLTDAQEDKNLNGLYEPNGEDGIPGTDDDETRAC